MFYSFNKTIQQQHLKRKLSYGIPTIFFTSLRKKFNMFHEDFKYPISNNLQFIENNYLESSKRVKKRNLNFICPLMRINLYLY